MESAFYHSPAVMCVSLHLKARGFFPGSGDSSSCGDGPGRGTNINVPLPAGTRSEEYLQVFDGVLSAAVEHFEPNAIVMQCGTDAVRLL